MKLRSIAHLAAALLALCSGPATAAQYDFDYNYTNAQGGKSAAKVNLAPGAAVLGLDPVNGKFKRYTAAEWNEMVGPLTRPDLGITGVGNLALASNLTVSGTGGVTFTIDGATNLTVPASGAQTAEVRSARGAASGYAPLDAAAQLPFENLPTEVKNGLTASWSTPVYEASGKIYAMTADGAVELSAGSTNKAPVSVADSYAQWVDPSGGVVYRATLPNFDSDDFNLVAVTPGADIQPIVYYGQSLSVGAGSPDGPITSGAQDGARCVMFSAGTILNTGTTSPLADSRISDLVPLENGSQECPGTIASFKVAEALNVTVASIAAGYTGMSADQLKKGGSTGLWANMMQSLTRLKVICDRLGLVMRTPVLVYVAGEADATNSIAAITSQMTAMHDGWVTDVRELMGDPTAKPWFFVKQMLSATHTSATTGTPGTADPLNSGKRYSFQPPVQYSLSQTLTHYVCLPPGYDTPYFVGTGTNHGVHKTQVGYRYEGEKDARAITWTLTHDEKWQPLHPVSALLAGNKITVKFAGSDVTLPIQFNETVVSDPNDHAGFEYEDGLSAGGSVVVTPLTASISSVALKDGSDDEVEITLTTTPTGSNKMLRLGFSVTADNTNGGGPTSGPRTTISDSSDFESSYDETPLPNYSVVCRIPVTAVP